MRRKRRDGRDLVTPESVASGPGPAPASPTFPAFTPIEDPTVAVLVIGKSDEEVSDFMAKSPHVTDEARIVLVSNPGMVHGGFAQIANKFIDESTEDIVGMVHADTTFAPGSITAFAAVAARGCVTGMTGRSRDGRYRWSRVLPEEEPTGGGIHGYSGGVVSTLDAGSVFMPRRDDLRFDGELFDGFHCVVEDLCLHAQYRLGMGVVVPIGIMATHVGASTGRPGWIDDWFRYQAKLFEKWRGYEVHTV